MEHVAPRSVRPIYLLPLLVLLLRWTLRLLPCRPNPFNAHANLNFSVPSTMYVTLEIFDLIGLHERGLPSGGHLESRRMVMAE